MFIEFEKWHGCGDDFVVIWTSPNQYKNIGPSLIRKSVEICARHSGIGADGILVLVHSPEKEVPEELVIINSDGSLADTCGNGIRCAAVSIYQAQLMKSKSALDSVVLKAGSVSYLCQFLPQKPALPLVQVDMGPCTLDQANSWHKSAVSFVNELLKKRKLEFSFESIHTGQLANQHLIFLLDKEAPLSLLRELGQALQNSPHWDGINVSFVHKIHTRDTDHPSALRHLKKSDSLKVFIWERGAGETQACGSAACAIASTILETELLSRDSWVPMQFPGGWLFAKQEEASGDVQLSGPAEFVFSGKLPL